ncbi:hypothetical protein ACWDRR_16115 [Kitasatospora sp. NPDC003701]
MFGRRNPRRQTAVYLRCYPGDQAGMECHRRALLRLATRLGLPEPVSYVDDGRRHRDGLPRLDSLERQIENGWIDTLLIPGPFVFALDDAVAGATVRRLEGLGCRVIELPVGGSYPVPPVTPPGRRRERRRQAGATLAGVTA